MGVFYKNVLCLPQRFLLSQGKCILHLKILMEDINAEQCMLLFIIKNEFPENKHLVNVFAALDHFKRMSLVQCLPLSADRQGTLPGYFENNCA